MCKPKIIAIAKACGVTFIKGLKARLFVAAMDDVLTIPTPNTGTPNVVDALFTFVPASPTDPAGQFYVWATSKADGSWKCTPEGDDDNPVWKTEVKTFIYGIDADKSLQANETNGHEFIVIVPDNNGKNRIVGEVGRGCSIKMGEQTNDKNGYEVTITWESGYNPYFYTAALPTA